MVTKSAGANEPGGILLDPLDLMQPTKQVHEDISYLQLVAFSGHLCDGPNVQYRPSSTRSQSVSSTVRVEYTCLTLTRNACCSYLTGVSTATTGRAVTLPIGFPLPAAL